jgi:hypothetical protein
MKLKTGVKILVGISVDGIALAIYEIITCPLSALLSFSVAERLSTSPDNRASEPGTAITNLRRLPVRRTELLATEASFLVIPVFLAVIVLCYLVLRQRRFQVMGVPVTPQFVGLGILLIGFWNVLFSGLLFGERVHLHYVT